MCKKSYRDLLGAEQQRVWRIVDHWLVDQCEQPPGWCISKDSPDFDQFYKVIAADVEMTPNIVEWLSTKLIGRQMVSEFWEVFREDPVLFNYVMKGNHEPH